MLYDLLIRLASKNAHHIDNQCKCLERGDVVDLKPSEGAWWTQRELSKPEWLIIKAHLTEDLAFSLTAPQNPPDQTKEYLRLKRREINLDLGALGIQEQERSEDIKTYEYSTEEIINSIIIKERILEQDEV